MMDGERHLVPIPAEQLFDRLPSVAPFIAAGVDASRGKWQMGDAIQRLLRREAQLWGIGSPEGFIAAGVSELVNYPQKRIGRMVSFAGEDAKSWAWVVTQLEHWARCEGATGMELVTRPGWERLMRPYGYQRTHVTLEKDL